MVCAGGKSGGGATLGFEGIAPDSDFTGYSTPPGLTLSGVNFSINPAVSDGILFVLGRGFSYPGNSVLASQGSTTAVEDLLLALGLGGLVVAGKRRKAQA